MPRPMLITGFLFVASGWRLSASQAAPPCLDRAAAERPYSRVRLLDVVKSQTAVRAEYLIRTCGVGVAFSTDLEGDLRGAGAENSVIAAVREVAPKASVVEKKLEPMGPLQGDIRINSKDGLQYAYIPHGAFRMGCSTGESCYDDEKPAHEVRITKGFWMGQTHVTVEAYKRYVRSTGKSMPEEPIVTGDKRLNPNWSIESVPMTMVSWTDAHDYCEWSGMRLPTEAEWEYSARAGTSGPRYGELNDIAWCGGNSGDKPIDADDIWKTGQKNYDRRIVENNDRPRGVALKRANVFKLYDMLGNVYQWTADWYKKACDSDGMETDPLGPPGGEYRVLRGGSSGVVSAFVRASFRYGFPPTVRNYSDGFRCAGEMRVP